MLGRFLRQLRNRAGHRPDHPRGRVHPGLPAASRGHSRRDHEAAGAHRHRAGGDPGPPAPSRSGRQDEGPAVTTKDTARHDDLVAKLRERFGAAILDVDRSFDDCAVTVDRAVIHDLLAYLKTDHRFNLLMDIAGVDCMNLTSYRERFELAYMLYSVPADLRVR